MRFQTCAGTSEGWGGGDGGGQEARELRKLEKNRTFGFSGEVRKGYREESQYNNNFLAGDLRPPFLGESISCNMKLLLLGACIAAVTAEYTQVSNKSSFSHVWFEFTYLKTCLERFIRVNREE